MSCLLGSACVRTANCSSAGVTAGTNTPLSLLCSHHRHCPAHCVLALSSLIPPAPRPILHPFCAVALQPLSQLYVYTLSASSSQTEPAAASQGQSATCARGGMTAIEQSHRQWLEQGALLASEKKFIQSEAAARSCAPAHEPTVTLRSYDTRRLGYSLSTHPAAQFDRAKTSGGSPPLQHRDVLRSSGSMFFCGDADGSGLPHAEAKASIPPSPSLHTHPFLTPSAACFFQEKVPGAEPRARVP
jgi:hypothetical protein